MSLVKVNSSIQLYDSLETMFDEHKPYVKPDRGSYEQVSKNKFEVFKNGKHYTYTFDLESALAVCDSINK